MALEVVDAPRLPKPPNEGVFVVVVVSVVVGVDVLLLAVVESRLLIGVEVEPPFPNKLNGLSTCCGCCC